ncbi:MAG: hypothetical protein Q8S84_00815 [bacterium]|nr:hypothetical protein [bacterium]MDP3380122.1 hypothetical protein [bacterium]
MYSLFSSHVAAATTTGLSSITSVAAFNSTSLTVILAAHNSVFSCHNSSLTFASILYVHASFGATNLPVYTQAFVSFNLVTTSLIITLTSSNLGFVITSTS